MNSCIIINSYIYIFLCIIILVVNNITVYINKQYYRCNRV